MESNHPPKHHSDTNPSTSIYKPSSKPNSRAISTISTSAGLYGGDDETDGIECSRVCCKSCVAGAIADGVAVCCCPCAVVDLVAFVLIRVPWMVGRRCFKLVRGKRNRRIAECGGGGETRRRSNGMSRNYLERWKVSEGMIEVTTSFKFEDDDNDDDADERVWLELCRGFGRLSFTGISSVGKGS